MSSAAEALVVVEGDADFELILCDVMMPEIDGVAFHRLLCEKRPDLVERLVFMSGGVFSPALLSYIEDRGIELVDKPVQADTVVALLARSGRDSAPCGVEP